MRRWWDELVVDFYDRMDGLVGAAHKGRLDDDEHDLAVQMAMTRFAMNLIDTYEGESIGQLVNACKTLARGICIDVQRLSISARGPGVVSLDEGWDADPEDDRPGPAWEAKEAHKRLDAEERGREASDFLDWALPQVTETRRRVLELTFQGATLDEIRAELGLEADAAYQRRSRGMQDLSRLKELYDA